VSKTTTCSGCGVHIVMMDGVYEALKQSSSTFYCLWGHAQHFPKGPTAEDTLRQERDRLKQETARLEERALAAERAEQAALEHAQFRQRQAAAARGQVTRLKNRAAAGLCPCCNRSFTNLQRHMATKHAGFTVEEVAAEGAPLH